MVAEQPEHAATWWVVAGLQASGFEKGWNGRESVFVKEDIYLFLTQITKGYLTGNVTQGFCEEI